MCFFVLACQQDESTSRAAKLLDVELRFVRADAVLGPTVLVRLTRVRVTFLAVVILLPVRFGWLATAAIGAGFAIGTRAHGIS